MVGTAVVLGFGLGSEVVVSLPPYAESRVFGATRDCLPLLSSLWKGFDIRHLDFFSLGSSPAGVVADVDMVSVRKLRDYDHD
jgi:hypothetical protein